MQSGVRTGLASSFDKLVLALDVPLEEDRLVSLLALAGSPARLLAHAVATIDPCAILTPSGGRDTCRCRERIRPCIGRRRRD